MRDNRRVDELSIEELERTLAIRKREARIGRLHYLEGWGRRVVVPASQRALNKTEVEANLPLPQPVNPPVGSPHSYCEDAPHFEDEYGACPKHGRGQGRSVRLWNRLFLIVEVAAVLGLLLLFIALFQSLQEISQTSANIQADYQATARSGLILPTATPIINIASVVLPVGHKVNVNDRGVVSASPNLDEVPAQYREQYRVFMTQPQIQPTSRAEGPVRIQIPKINVDSAVVSGDTWESLKLGVGHHIGSEDPGQRGNIVLSGHNDVYGEVFRHLDQLAPSDTIVVSSITGDYTYIVQERQIVNPDAVWVLDSRGDTHQLTLISCYPYRVDNKRIVVFATLQS